MSEINSQETGIEVVMVDPKAELMVTCIELYREYASEEIAAERDFLTFSEWKELNKELLQ